MQLGPKLSSGTKLNKDSKSGLGLDKQTHTDIWDCMHMYVFKSGASVSTHKKKQMKAKQKKSRLRSLEKTLV